MNKLSNVAKNQLKKNKAASPFGLFNHPIFHDFFGPSNLMNLDHQFSNTMKSFDYLPQVDIKENANGYKVHVDLPGIKKEDLNIKFDKGTLTIEGERNESKEENDTVFHRVERKYGKFIRSFHLPEDVDANSFKAKFVDGVLDISFEKKAKKEDESIKINVE